MRRLRRTLLFTATTLSLLVCLGSAALWVQSYRLCGRYETPHQRPFHWSLDVEGMGRLPSELWWVQWQLQWRRGRFAVIRSNLVFFQEHKGDTLGASCSCLLVEKAGLVSYIGNPGQGFTHWKMASVCHVRHTGTLKFMHDATAAIASDGVWFLEVPAWMPTLAGGFLPLYVLTQGVRRQQSRARGRCRICGYDLRATPERCPECGMVPADASAR